MTLREYGTITTVILGSIFGFELVWNLTSMEAVGAAFTAFMIGIFAGCVFQFVTVPREEKEPEEAPDSVWSDDGGLSVLIQRTRRVS